MGFRSNVFNPGILVRTIFPLLLLLIFFQCRAQKQATNWFFWNFDLHFNHTSLNVGREYDERQNHGFGVISDHLGNLLFYSDGFSVWNRNRQVMSNGNNLIPWHDFSVTQESLVVPQPGSDHIFYLFTADPWNGQETSGLYYSIIDLREGGLGEVTSKSNRLLTNTTNKISAVLHRNRNDVWLLAHEHNTNRYSLFLVTASGIEAKPVQELGAEHAFWDGQLKFSPDGKRMAVNYVDPSPGFSIFDFNDSTGILSNAMDFKTIGNETSPWFQGLEFSGDGQKLFLSEQHSVSTYQLDLFQKSPETLLNSAVQIEKQPAENLLKQLQLAPDGKIYATKASGNIYYMSMIGSPNERGTSVNLMENGLDLQGGDCLLNFTPNFIQNYFFRTSFEAINTCVGQPTLFQISNTYRLDSARWLFDDESYSIAISPEHVFDQPGAHLVHLLAHYPEKTDTISRAIQVNVMPDINLGSDTAVCKGYLLEADPGHKTYFWNDSTSKPLLTVRESGVYKVTAQNKFGCFASDSVFIEVKPQPRIQLPDTLFLGSADSVLLAPGEFHSYQWNTGATGSSIYVKNPGIYSVLVENTEGCRSARTVMILEDPVPPQNLLKVRKWEHLNPLPSGFAANDMFFLNDTLGFIINDHQLLRTTDRGLTWEVLSDTIGGQRIEFSAGIGYVVGNQGAAYKSTHLGAAWTRINGFSPQDNLNAISIINWDTLMVTSDNKLFISTNGGMSWTSKKIDFIYVLREADVEDSWFFNALKGSVACENGLMLKTNDGGESWQPTLTSDVIPSNFNRIYFIDQFTGFALRDHSNLYKTINGGESWNLVNGSLEAFDLHFLDQKNGFAAGEFGGIFMTTDGGLTWNSISQSSNIGDNDLSTVFFLNEMVGYAAGLMGRILKTSDGGLNWQQYATTYQDILQLQFAGNAAFIEARDQIYHSYNEGKQWEVSPVPRENQHLGAFDFINQQIGYAITGGTLNTSNYSGYVYKTTDGGLTWFNPALGEVLDEDLYCIDFVNENFGFASGGFNLDGTFRTTDGGASWQRINDLSFRQMQFLSTQTGYAGQDHNGGGRIYKTTDQGASWNIVFESEDLITDFDFPDELNGYLTGANGLCYKTTDGGANWQKLEVPYRYFIDIQFYDAAIGYLLQDHGDLYHTMDGGLSWQEMGQNPGLNGIVFHQNYLYGFGKFGKIQRIPVQLATVGQPFAESLNFTMAILTGQLQSQLEVTEVFLEFGKTIGNYDQEMKAGTYVGETDQQISITLEGLERLTTYYCRFRLEGGAYTIYSPQNVFMTYPGTVTAIESDPLEERRVFPNPTTGKLQVIVPRPGNYNYRVMSLAGQPLLSGTLDEKAEIDLEKLRAGIYLVEIREGTGRWLQKVVKRY